MPEKLIKRGKIWYFRFTNADGKRVMRKGCVDKRATEEMARTAEVEAAQIRSRTLDPKQTAYRDHDQKPLAEHLEAWKDYLLGKGDTEFHAETVHKRAVKLTSTSNAIRLSDLTLTRIQSGLKTLKEEGLALRTVHHYARAIKNFSRWLWRDGRTRDDLLAHLQPPDHPETDRRRERRALSEEELIKLVSK